MNNYIINLQKKDQAGKWQHSSRADVVTCHPEELRKRCAEHYAPIRERSPGFRVRVRKVAVLSEMEVYTSGGAE